MSEYSSGVRVNEVGPVVSLEVAGPDRAGLEAQALKQARAVLGTDEVQVVGGYLIEAARPPVRPGEMPYNATIMVGPVPRQRDRVSVGRTTGPSLAEVRERVVAKVVHIAGVEPEQVRIVEFNGVHGISGSLPEALGDTIAVYSAVVEVDSQTLAQK